MRVAILAPWNLLQYSALSNYHLTLLHLYKIKEYKEFYLERARQGDFITLDNGANEGVDIDDADLVDAAIEYEVSEVVAPDQPRDGEESTERTLAFLSQYKPTLVARNILTMGCPHGQSRRQWLHNVRLIAPLVTTLGVSKKVEEIDHGDLQRPELVELVIDMSPKIHLLGADSTYWWIKRYDHWYNQLRGVRSVDTQKLVAAGLQDVPLDQMTTKAEVGSFDLSKAALVTAEHQDDIIRNNIRTYMEWANASS